MGAGTAAIAAGLAGSGSQGGSFFGNLGSIATQVATQSNTQNLQAGNIRGGGQQPMAPTSVGVSSQDSSNQASQVVQDIPASGNMNGAGLNFTPDALDASDRMMGTSLQRQRTMAYKKSNNNL
jgi:hypothetical protein